MRVALYSDVVLFLVSGFGFVTVFYFLSFFLILWCCFINVTLGSVSVVTDSPSVDHYLSGRKQNK